MSRYRVECNQMYFNQITETFEKGLILGASQFQYGDQFEATAAQVKTVVVSGDAVKI
tara:strand:+ start:688 stop:858 length:171 start_codon:yes stop_codon:yes gene_type:complete